MTKPFKQHSTPRDPLFTPVQLSGKNKTGQKIATPGYSAELAAPSAPKAEQKYNSPTTAGLKPVPPATK